MARQQMLRHQAAREQRHIGMPPHQRRRTVQIVVVEIGHVMGKDDNLVAGKIVQHAKPELMVGGVAVAEVRPAMHQDGAVPDLLSHLVRLVAASRTLIGARQSQFIEQAFFAEPGRVIAAIGGLGESDQADRPVAGNELRKRIDQELGRALHKIVVAHRLVLPRILASSAGFRPDGRSLASGCAPLVEAEGNANKST